MGGERERPAFRCARDGAAETVLGANRARAELTSVVVDAEGRYRRLSGLRPLACTDGRGNIASALAATSSPSRVGLTLEKEAERSSARDKHSLLGVSLVAAAAVRLCGEEARENDRLFGRRRDDGGQVHLEVEELAFVGGECGGVAAFPPNPA